MKQEIVMDREKRCMHCNDLIEIIQGKRPAKGVCELCKIKGLKNLDKRSNGDGNKTRKKTLLDRYGVDNVMSIPGVADKVITTSFERYGGIGYTSSYGHKCLNTTEEKFGNKLFRKSDTWKSEMSSNNPMKDSKVSDKAVATHIKKYGGVGFNASYAEQGRQTTERIYGNRNIMKTDHGKSFFIGDNNPMKRSEVAKKVSKTLKGHKSKLKNRTYVEIHGIEESNRLKEERKNLFKTRFLNSEEFEDMQLEFNMFLVNINTYPGSLLPTDYICGTCNNIMERTWYDIQQGYLCLTCSPRDTGTSKGERQVLAYVESLLPDDTIVHPNLKTIIPPKELDIYIPSLNLAIEYDGLYHHRTAPDNHESTYHLNKTNNCKNLNIRLLHFFEDEWKYKQNIVEMTIRRILNISNNETNLNISDVEISNKCLLDKSDFLNKYHILGNDNSDIEIGGYYKNELVAIMTFSNIENNNWILSRFATNSSYIIPSIEFRLFQAFLLMYSWVSITSYSDLRFSQGNMLTSLGFEKIDELEPFEYIINDVKRIPSFLVEDDEELKDKYSDHFRIHDCGGHIYYIENPSFSE